MSDGFAPSWLAARDPYDVAALDREAISMLRAWADRQPTDRPLRVVDLGCGTGSGLHRALTWLANRPVQAYAVDRDAALLVAFSGGDGRTAPSEDDVRNGAESSIRGVRVSPVVADVLGPLEAAGGPSDATVDLVISHAVADLLPLELFATRIAALLRPGGHAHLGLTYDGETAFSPTDDPMRDRRVIDAYHRHMDQAREREPDHGGSTAGRRLAAALMAAGLEVVRAAPSTWDVRAADGPAGRAVLAGLIGFVIDSLSELNEPPADELSRWERARRRALDAGELRARVRHLDVLVRRPERAASGAEATRQ